MSTIAPSLSLPVMPNLPESDLAGLSARMLTGAGAQAPPTGPGGQAAGAGRSPQAVGKGFEEIFASILFKQMRQTIGENGMFGHDPGDVLGGMFDHFMSQHIAQTGKLGIGKMIQKQLENRSAHS